MATRKLTRKPTTPTRTARRASPPAARAAAQPMFARVEKDLVLEAPAGFAASAILKLVDRDRKRRVYAFWLLVGRDGHDAASAPFQFDGGDYVRVDLPTGFVGTGGLARRLHTFLKAEGTLDPDPPTIKH